ncbi:MAG: hypothetical protein JWO20_260 [Candidatus Angelobacter sp.]|nr:hypothetical protein [Candidatus Angelobacter sp.]
MKSKSDAEIRIGTSGWHYKHWLGSFYPEKLPFSKMLQHYWEHFDTVEINNSFYMLPQVSTLEGWRAATPRNFKFAMKASRFLTHNKKLKDPENALNNFLPRAEALGEKLGPILFQLPPKWKVNRERLEELLQTLPTYHRYAFEFREPSWINPEIYDVLRKYNAAFCIYELAGFRSPIEVTADIVYVRLHGPGDRYQGSYDQKTLAAWAKRIENWAARGKSVFVYFDNDQAGYAAENALTLKRMVASSQPRALRLRSGQAEKPAPHTTEKVA